MTFYHDLNHRRVTTSYIPQATKHPFPTNLRSQLYPSCFCPLLLHFCYLSIFHHTYLGYHLPWEDADFEYPGNFAPPLQIAIEASNGASDYGNKFGEPVILGFARSFGLKLPNNERREWIKPIMFSGGIGSIEDEHLKKEEPSKGKFFVGHLEFSCLK